MRLLCKKKETLLVSPILVLYHTWHIITNDIGAFIFLERKLLQQKLVKFQHLYLTTNTIQDLKTSLMPLGASW